MQDAVQPIVTLDGPVARTLGQRHRTCLAQALGRRRDPVPLEHSADRRATHPTAQLGQLARDAAVAPRRVLARQPRD
ncbi:MAG TPA: hypothetical protein VIJ28_16620 [Chloroflexota bacterium]